MDQEKKLCEACKGQGNVPALGSVISKGAWPLKTQCQKCKGLGYTLEDVPPATRRPMIVKAKVPCVPCGGKGKARERRTSSNDQRLEMPIITCIVCMGAGWRAQELEVLGVVDAGTPLFDRDVEPFETMCELQTTVASLGDLLDDIQDEIARAYEADSEEDHKDKAGNAEEVLQELAATIDRILWAIAEGAGVLPSKKCGLCCGCCTEQDEKE